MRPTLSAPCLVALLALAAAPVAAHGQAEKGARLDLFGEPLPARGLARLESPHLRKKAVKSARPALFLQGGDEVVALSPDGKLLASAGESRPVRLWDSATGSELPRRGLPIPGGRDLVFSPDGAKLLVIRAFATATVYALPSGKQLSELEKFGRANAPPVFSADGKAILGVAAREHLGTWDAATGKLLSKRRVEEGDPRALALSRDGKLLAVGCSTGELLFFNDPAGKPFRQIEAHEAPVVGVAISPDGRWVASRGEDHKIRLWDARTGKAAGAALPASGFATRVEFAANGKSLVCIGRDGLTVHEVPGGKIRAVSAGIGWAFVRSFALSRDGKTVFWAEGSPSLDMGKVVGKSIETVQPERLLPLALTFTPDGKQVRTAGGGLLGWWDAATGRELRRTRIGGESETGPVFAGQGRTLAVRAAKAVRLLDGAGKQFAAAARPGASRELLALSADGALLAVAEREQVRLYEAGMGQARRTLAVPGGRVTALAFSADGKLLATAGADGVVRLWDTAKGTERGRSARLDQRVGALAFNSAGDRLAAGDWVGRLLLWDLRQLGERVGMRQTFRRKAHGDSVSAVAFAPGGRTLASGGWDGGVGLWDDDGHELLRLAGHADEVTALAFAPDGARLASGSRDHTVLIWDVKPSK